MDTTDPDICFDSNGTCNYCNEVEIQFNKMTEEESTRKLNAITEQIKRNGEGKEYDCLLGISGGVDSSYVAYLAKQLGLRPLTIHFDNGWNSELAVSNISKLMQILDFDLQTYVIDWEEFRDLQRAFIKASVIDIEILTDHAIMAAMFKIAQKYKIRYILTGVNNATENGMPKSWVWSKRDLRNIRAIQKRFGTRPLKSFPTLGTWRWIFIKYFSNKYEFVDLLNYINFRKEHAISVLEDKVGWRYYGGKHYESLFTKFYQAYILPEKFGVDKRKVHFSSLIRNKELTREQALEELAKPLYDQVSLKNDKEYILKKLGFTNEEFNGFMNEPPRPHDYYPSDYKMVEILRYLKEKLTKGKVF